MDLLYPALGGAGSAHLPYNTVRIEAVDAESPRLPEFVRLGWLLSQLNVDLPMFSEPIPADRRSPLAGLAMLPAMLFAAWELDLLPRDPDLPALAVQSWLAGRFQAEALAPTLESWWQSYQEMRPRWQVALSALDAMLGNGIEERVWTVKEETAHDLGCLVGRDAAHQELP